MRRILPCMLGVGVGVIVLGLGSRAELQESSQLVVEGRTVFVAQGCYGCHTLGGVGTAIAPDLTHVGARYPEAALRRWLRDPALQRPTAHMPKIPMTDAQLDALAAYLASLR